MLFLTSFPLLFCAYSNGKSFEIFIDVPDFFDGMFLQR